jgi:hypothetical protein
LSALSAPKSSPKNLTIARGDWAIHREVEYATKRYSESSIPADTKTDKGESSRKRHRDVAPSPPPPQMQVELDSSSDEAPTAPRSGYLREINCKIDYNGELQRA